VIVRTSAPVTIENANIESEGDLIDTDVAGANLTIENTSGWALNPDASGQTPGRFLDADGFVNIDLENNFLAATSGIELSHYAGNNTPSQAITVDKNLALNIDGRESTGKGGYSTSAYQDVQFLQLSHDSDLVGAEIAWNQVFNQPGQSRVEDNISIFESGGTSASHLEIHDNFIDGGYPADPTDSTYTGGGILLGDGDASVEPSGYVDAYDNQVLDTTNYGIAIAASSNNTISNNRVISTGALSDGTPLPAENVGIYIWQNNPGPFSNNISTGNVIGWQVVSSSGAISRNDEWLPDAAAGTGQDTSLPGPITQATEENEYSIWSAKLQQNDVTVGPT
jgi:parallel beta-helix repeat protein